MATSAPASVAKSLILLETLSNTVSRSGASAVLASSKSFWMSKYSSLARGVVVGGSFMFIFSRSFVGVRRPCQLLTRTVLGRSPISTVSSRQSGILGTGSHLLSAPVLLAGSVDLGLWCTDPAVQGFKIVPRLATALPRAPTTKCVK